MTDTKLLEKKIKESGLKRQFLAKKLKISRFAFAQKINNESEFKASEIVTLCKELHITSAKEKEAIFFAQQGELESLAMQGDDD